MFCGKCGYQLPEGTKFCGVCGAPLAVKQEVQAPVTDDTASNQTVTQTTQTAQKTVAEDIEKPITSPKVPNTAPTQKPIAPKQNTAKSAPKKKENKFVKTMLSILCVIMIFFFSFVAMTIFSIRTTISEKNVEKVMDNVNAGDFIKDADLGTLDDSMTSKEANKLFKRPYVKEYISRITGEYTGYLLGGEKPRGIKGEDLVKLMEDNQDDIEEVIGKKLTQKDFDNAYEYGEAEEENELGILSGNVRTNSTFELVRISVSVVTLIIFLVLAALFVFLLFKARRYSLSSLLWSGYTFIAVALMFGLIALIKNLLPGILGGEEPIIAEAVSLISGALTVPVLISSGVVLVIGIVLIGTYMIASKIKKSKLKDKQAA